MTGLPHLFPHFAFSYYHYYKKPISLVIHRLSYTSLLPL
jgi:hypothetical protein